MLESVVQLIPVHGNCVGKQGSPLQPLLILWYSMILLMAATACKKKNLINEILLLVLKSVLHKLLASGENKEKEV
jgi:hypothetical protein